MKGEYASKIKRGGLFPIVPTTQSLFINLMSRPNEVIVLHLREVYDGKGIIAGLNTHAQSCKMSRSSKTRTSILWAVQEITNQLANEGETEKVYPKLLSQKFRVDFVQNHITSKASATLQVGSRSAI